MMDYLRRMTLDVDGMPSSKRFVMLLSFFVFVFAIGANLFTGKLIDKEFIDTLSYIILGGLGAVGAEKVTDRKQDDSRDPNSTNP
jgi:hypothetical protein